MKQLVHDLNDRGNLVVFIQPSITVGHDKIFISVKMTIIFENPLVDPEKPFRTPWQST